MSEVREETLQAGKLTYRRLTAAENPTLGVLLCHGYGAPGTDLVPFGPELIRSSPDIAARAVFLFPEAPIRLGGIPGYEQRAWWNLDIAALETAMAEGKVLDRRNDCPEELPALRTQLHGVISAETERSGIEFSRFVVGGFSQGSMVTTDLTVHSGQKPAALCAFSGTLLCEDVWKDAARDLKGLRVLQSHGRQDPLLPFAAAEMLRDLLQKAGAEVQFVGFDGQHEIPMPVLVAFRDLLVSLA